MELDKADGGSGVQAPKAGFELGAAPKNFSHLQAWLENAAFRGGGFDGCFL